MFILNLIQNIALLVALAVLYQVLAARLNKESLENKIVSGLLFGVVGVIGMMTPLHFMPGIIFDGRSIILSISGFLGGPVVALVAALMGAVYRIHLGGGGVYVGVATIIESAALGVAFHYLWYRRQKPVSLFKLWLFGLMSSVVVLITFLALPGKAGLEVVPEIGLTILILYPLASMLVCQLFFDYEKQAADAKALLQSESIYRGIFENAAAGVAVVDAQGRFLQVNSTLCRMLGYSPEELLKLTMFDVSHPDDRQISATKHEQMVSGEIDSYKFVKRFIRKDGQLDWAEVSGSTVYVPDGAYHSTIGVVSDITARKLAEDYLKERERMWAALIENLPGFVYRCANDREWTMQYISPGCLQLTGYTPDELTHNRNLSFNDIMVPEYSDPVWYAWQEALESKRQFEGEYPIITKSGEERWLWERGRGVHGENGELMFLEGFITDVTHRKLTEQALRESQQRYQELFRKSRLQEELYLSMLNCSADPIIVYDMKGNVQYLNPAHTELFGWTLDEVAGKRLDTVPEWDRKTTRAIIEKIVKTGNTNRSYETQRLTRDGRTVDVSISASRYHDHDGNPAGILVIIQNISRRKKAQEVQRRLATAIEQAAEAVVITDSSAVIQYVNPAFEKVTGFLSSEVLGQKPSILKSGMHDDDFYRQLWSTINSGMVWSGRFINKRKDESLYYEDATISPVRDFSGQINNFVAVKRDVTETIDLTRQLLHSQKMEAIGTLAGGIAHDFNNLLQVVMGYCEILKGSPNRTEADCSDLDKIYAAGKRGAELVSKLLTFSRNEQVKLLPTDLNMEIIQIRDLLARTIAKSIEIKLELSDNLDQVYADRSQLAQLIMNLAVNARDAMPDGGTLLIRTENAYINDDYCRQFLKAAPGPYVCLIVSDTGTGMDKCTMDHIFEPFFSTKEVGKGTGLGLATVYGIVTNHGGHITCSSERAKGSTFTIYFPKISVALDE